MKAAGTAQAPARGRPRKAAIAKQASASILDAAEDLFSKNGFYGTTIREVARQAKVDTALLHYYFGNKRGLFDAVFQRRAEYINTLRIDALNLYERTAGANVTVEGAIEAFTGPLFDTAATGDVGWHNYFALMAQVNNTPEWGGETMTHHFDPVVHRLIEVVRRALPGASEQDLYWSYQFLSGALTLTLSRTGRIDRLSGGICRSGDFSAIHERMVPFIADGFRALCRPNPTAALSNRKRGRV
ncbi:MAG: TetR/AcrR family transcriptional regulator [Pseudomonadota bacterium]